MGTRQAAELHREHIGSTVREIPGPGTVAKPKRLQPSSPCVEGAGRSSTGFGTATNVSE